MEQLLEDYKRRLETVNESLNSLEDGGVTKSLEITYRRLETKASCYRTFIAELEREIANVG